MRISRAGKGGAMIAAAGAVAIGVAGVSTGSGAGDGKTSSTDAMQRVADGIGTSSTGTGASSTSGVAAGGTTTGGTSATSTAVALSAAVHTTHTTQTLAKTNTTAKTKTPAKPKPTNWLAGVPLGHNTPGALDPRCKTGRVICIDMSTRTLLWVVNGKPQYGMDVRFGDAANPTRKGKFDIYLKMEHCISTIYHTSMPDAMFFSGGEAVHFSIDFATYGYAHHSHGCVNVRDRAAVAKLFADTRVGDTVVVY